MESVKDNLRVSDTYIDTYNPIFKTLYDLYARKQKTIPSHVIKVELGTLNAHNIYIHRPINNRTTLAAWKNLQPKVRT
jgi:replicative DNA helicase